MSLGKHYHTEQILEYRDVHTVEPLNCGQIWDQSNMVTIESFYAPSIHDSKIRLAFSQTFQVQFCVLTWLVFGNFLVKKTNQM